MSTETEIGILFNGPAVRAIRAGLKTMTVRPYLPRKGRLEWVDLSMILPRPVFSVDDYRQGCGTRAEVAPPRGREGQFWYVRETFHAFVGHDYEHEPPEVSYRADWGDDSAPPRSPMGTWTPSIHMPKKFSRIRLRVTELRFMRLEELNDDDIRAEGVTGSSPEDRRARFRELWDGIYGETHDLRFDESPWVWVYRFEVIL